jgi:hypothetical protein
MDTEKLRKIITERESRPNSDLIKAMDFLQEDFDETKKNLVKLSRHLDGVENLYNQLLKEYKKRVK